MAKSGVFGNGECGGKIALAMLNAAKDVKKTRRGVRILAGQMGDPIDAGVIVMNLARPDFRTIKEIRHRVLVPSRGSSHGGGAGKQHSYAAETILDTGVKQIVLKYLRENNSWQHADFHFVIASADGGTGSGFLGPVIAYLKGLVSVPVYAVLVLPVIDPEAEDGLGVENTAKCLHAVINESGADAMFFIDNQRFVEFGQSVEQNYEIINRAWADPWKNPLAAAEDREEGHLTPQIADVRDLTQTILGLSTIGMGRVPILKKPPFMARLFSRNRDDDNGRVQELGREESEQSNRALDALSGAFRNCTIDPCFVNEEGELQPFCLAERVFCLLAAPSNETSPAVLGAVRRELELRVPQADVIIRTYAGGYPDLFEVVVIIGNIGESAANRKIEHFIERGKKVQLIRESRTAHIADGIAETKSSMKDLKDRTQIPQLPRPSPRPADISRIGGDHEGLTILRDEGKNGD